MKPRIQMSEILIILINMNHHCEIIETTFYYSKTPYAAILY